MTKRHGVEYVVKYLKLSALITSKTLAGEKINSYNTIDPDLFYPRLRGGFPAIIGTKDRRSLKQGSYKTIRL